MKRDHKRQLLALAAIVIATGLTMPILFGTSRKPDGTGGDPWRNTLLDFQTLITGVMAVGAAYYTVQQMRESDRQQDLRQRRQMQGDRWREKIAAARLVNRLTPQLGMLSNSVRRIWSRMEFDAFAYGRDEPHLTNGWKEYGRNDYFNLLFEVRKLQTMISEIPRVELELLTHQAEDSLRQLRQVLERAMLTASNKRPDGYAPHPTDAPPWLYNGEAAAILVDTVRMADVFLVVLHKWHRQFLEDLGEERH